MIWDRRCPPSTVLVVVLSILVGSSLAAGVMTYLSAAKTGVLAMDRTEEERLLQVFGHQMREAPETIAECALRMQEIHDAVDAFEQHEGCVPVSYTGSGGFPGGRMDEYLKDLSCLICPADPTKGELNRGSGRPNSRMYMYSRYWLEKNGGKRLPLTPDAVLTFCGHHPGVVLILRYSGVIELAPKGKYERLGVSFTEGEASDPDHY